MGTIAGLQALSARLVDRGEPSRLLVERPALGTSRQIRGRIKVVEVGWNDPVGVVQVRGVVPLRSPADDRVRRLVAALNEGPYGDAYVLDGEVVRYHRELALVGARVDGDALDAELDRVYAAVSAAHELIEGVVEP